MRLGYSVCRHLSASAANPAATRASSAATGAGATDWLGAAAAVRSIRGRRAIVRIAETPTGAAGPRAKARVINEALPGCEQEFEGAGRAEPDKLPTPDW